MSQQQPDTALRLRLAVEQHIAICKKFGPEGFQLNLDPKDVLSILDQLQAGRTRVAKLEAELVSEAACTAEYKLRANQMTDQHRMQSTMHSEARKELAEEKDATDNWRRLALQFDGHRMELRGHLTVMVQDPQKHTEAARAFLAAAPMPGEQVLAERIAAMAKMVSAAPEHPNHSPDAGKMVACACGDQFPIDSYGGGFLDAKGKCFGCDAEARLQGQALLTESQIEELFKASDLECLSSDDLEAAIKFVRAVERYYQIGRPSGEQCWCTTCRPITLEDMRFVVCPECGNKRCPRAHNHELACTGSNALGQPGSSWEHVKGIDHAK